ncbi:MAG TPA: tyrosine-type recombinase/integrase [Candidatus Accumulibacter phosphatis]|nr:MAG: integrase [Candidatus Accumulibacter sp. SK-11]HAY28996.1 integrase [Accumulibacter sp.]HCN67289.1 integrase [Accumulibacter sp.]HRL74244.1 tyrosine-type recombinase/integrase [Candidatus Accumulibacter phosphatis]HRQ93533.1 tyrosine-type recombinase/integrase [Candidatus Accumulibacter phosphatis]
MNRPKTTSSDLPPRVIRRVRRLKSGKLWEGFYYWAAADKREIPLGTDRVEALRKWAELEAAPVPVEAGTMRLVFDRYEREIIPDKASKTQASNRLELARLRSVFDSAPIDAITPQHIAQYRDSRMTKARTLKDGTVIPARRATIAANRELALFSNVFNKAREWGYTAKTNPCAGVAKNKETPRDFYADDAVWSAVRNCAPAELQDLMDLAYLSGQRPGDVLRMTMRDVVDDALVVRQGKTRKQIRIQLNDADGGRTKLGQLIDRIKRRPVSGLYLATTDAGRRMTVGMLRLRFVAARDTAASQAESAGNAELAARVRQFQFRDSRPKAASEIADLGEAAKLLGHSDKELTKVVYRRIGESAKPTR